MTKQPKDSNKEADLSVMTVDELKEGSDATRDRLLQACQTAGFFYLDYRNTGITETDKLYGVMSELFALPLDEKSNYHVKSQGGPELMDGYRETGLSTGPYAGKQDGFESYMIPKNAFISGPGKKAFKAPVPLRRNEQLIERCMSEIHDLALRVLTLLSRALGVDQTKTFQDWHRINEPSTTVLGLLQYLPPSPDADKVGHFAHTDVGTLSFVFSAIGGLQICPPDQEEWEFVPPRPGLAVVNVGDSLTFMAQQKLPSILHRVIPHPAEAGVKQTIGYFLRPELDTPLVDREGVEWQSHDWHKNKCRVFRAPREEQAKHSYLTGRDNYLGLANESKAPTIDTRS